MLTIPDASASVCHRRRKLGRWSQAEVETLIRKMEAAHHWCQIRDEWPRLGFPRRSDVDLKDKWRNLEDVVLHGKATRTVQLTEEQKGRIHRCYRKYRVMEPAGSPDSHTAAEEQTQANMESSPAKRHKSANDSYQPSDDHKSLSSSGSPSRRNNLLEMSPMTTRSKARAVAAGQPQDVNSPAQNA